jgi:hypothetical protein
MSSAVKGYAKIKGYSELENLLAPKTSQPGQEGDCFPLDPLAPLGILPPFFQRPISLWEESQLFR